MNCSTIGLELSSLIKTPTVAVKQKCPETSMSCQSLRQMEVEVFRAPRNPILNNWDQSVRPPTITGQIPGVPMAPAPSRHRGHRRIPCASSPDWGRIHYYGLNNLVVKFSGEQNCLCFMVCKLESFAGIPNRHLLQSGLSQSDQLGQTITNYDYADVVCISNQEYIFSHLHFQQLIIQDVPQQRPNHGALGNPPENLKAHGVQGGKALSESKLVLGEVTMAYCQFPVHYNVFSSL
ncbi:uncharacterized protein LOC114882392 isoform X1 [Osmia bicornis bicornis]|uniref:uncharacterized protein LOC123988812 isoform X4 n=1 Tax=Osmia bicornis bicornis TaxID=1437191 RepID=UPI001EAF0C7E|nr:uncharacterized protein LOC123988812 isoform X4 [Osmia bicornis bicornis]XP_046145672.1 uncharacterized protein LOC114882392 isoform X1 [Osmia bicornis bicornis]